MSEFRVNSITNQDGSAGPQVCGVSTFSGKSGVQIPSGSSDFRRLDGGGRGRGVFAGGANPSRTSTCEKIEIATTGNASDFGTLSAARAYFDGCSSSTRGVVGGGGNPSGTNIIEYLTVSSAGNAADFGDLILARRYLGSANSPTRGLFAGAHSPVKSNSIEFVTIATTGDASEFGDLISAKQLDAGTSSPTRAVFAGGEGQASNTNPNASPASPFTENIIEFVTIATKGDGQDFGDLTFSLWGVGATGNSTRGIFFGGNPSKPTDICFITIATLGNATDFGDLLAGTGYANGVSNKTRGVIGGGEAPNAQNVLQFVTISTAGNTTNFGDLATTRARGAAFSDLNGGLDQ